MNVQTRNYNSPLGRSWRRPGQRWP